MFFMLLKTDKDGAETTITVKPGTKIEVTVNTNKEKRAHRKKRGAKNQKGKTIINSCVDLPKSIPNYIFISNIHERES